MKYYLDSEFMEYPGYIDLISIAVIREDNKSVYGLNKECCLKNIWKDEWLNENVLKSIYKDYMKSSESEKLFPYNYKNVKKIFDTIGFSRKELSECIYVLTLNDIDKQIEPEFWGYYSDYDWVTLCWLYGRMIDLPKGWPMYCRDLKQLCDEKKIDPFKLIPENNKHLASEDALWAKNLHSLILNDVRFCSDCKEKKLKCTHLE